MYPQYPDTPEGRAREALEHPHGEEYPGQHDGERELLKDLYPDEDIDAQYGKTQDSKMGS